MAADPWLLIERLMSTLAEVLGDPGGIQSLQVLVEPGNAKKILDRYLQRAGGHSTPFIRSLAVAMVTVARDWVRLEANSAAMVTLKRMARRAESALPKGLTEKNRTVVRQLEDPVMQQRLIDLPTVLAEQARTGRYSLARRIQKFNIALAIQILLVVPLRLQNLSALHLDRQLVWPNGPQGKLVLFIEGRDTKNGDPLDYAIPDHTKRLLEECRDRYRVHCKPRNEALFIQPNGAPVTAATLRDGITKAIRRELGIHMTPHQFRHFAATVMLDAHPGAYAIVADLLGQKNLKTTIAFYSGRRTRQAGQAYDEVLRSRRRSSPDDNDA